MAGKYKAYADYKPSGVKWLGDIPSGWDVSRLGFECSVKARLGWKGLKAEEYVYVGYIFLATPNLKTKDIDFENVNYITKQRYEESLEIALSQGDVLLTKDGSTTGTVNIVRNLPRPATVNSSIAVVRSDGKIDPLYLYYAIASDGTQNVIKMMQGGMGVPHLFQADLRKFDVVLPSLPEQRQIAKFLDHETAKIDQLIKRQERLIVLLEEKRQAVISHAVTKGLDPSAPLRPSGIDWLGDVPEHWEVKRVKHVAKTIGTGGTPKDINLISETGQYNWFTPSDFSGSEIMEKSKNMIFREQYHNKEVKIFDKDSVLVVGIGATLGKVGVCERPFSCNQQINVITLNRRFHALFLKAALFSQTEQMKQLSNASTIGIMNQEKTGSILIAVPPNEEQLHIIVKLKKFQIDIKILVTKAQAAITLLKERRTALISAAVTGKIDVRDWQPPEDGTPKESWQVPVESASLAREVN